MKSATVYNYKNYLVFVVNHRYNDGIVRNTIDIELFNLNVCPNTLTSALGLCLDRFTDGLEYQPELNNVFQSKIMDILGIKSFKNFTKISNMVVIADSGEELMLQPLISSTKFNGFESFKGILESYNKSTIEVNGAINGLLNLFKVMKLENGHI